MKAALLVLSASLLASGCSDDKPAPANPTSSVETLRRDCADPRWKEQNLGLWYSLCRQPLRW